MQLAEDLHGGIPVVVFMTAFSQHAVRAFDLAATDYVLKPFSDERFLEALGRAKRRVRERRLGELASQMAGVAAELQQTEPAEPSPDGSRYLQRLSLKQGDRTLVLRTEEIVWIEAQDYCVMVHSTQGKHLVRGSLTTLEGQLDPRHVRPRASHGDRQPASRARNTRPGRASPRAVGRLAGRREPIAQAARRVAAVAAIAVIAARSEDRALRYPVTLQRAAASWLRSGARACRCKPVEAARSNAR